MGDSLRMVCYLGYSVVLTGCGSVTAGSATHDGGTDTQLDGQIGDATLPAGASCTGLPMSCGAGRNDSCCDSPEVLGGTFYRGYDVAGDPSSGNQNSPATISSFRLDKYEITVGRFRSFIKAGLGIQANPPMMGAGEHKNLPGSGWDANWNASLSLDTTALIAAVKCGPLQTWTDVAGSNENRPMNCVTWYEAMAFCVWDGGYLPTEAEWNYAVSGGDQQRAYPWSSPPGSLTIDAAHASYLEGTDCTGDGRAGCEVTDLIEVGTKSAGDGRWGQSDLAGNTSEWVLDWAGAYPSNCVDCANLIIATNRETRGGGFDVGDDDLRSGVRIGVPPSFRSSGLGFRCARPN